MIAYLKGEVIDITEQAIVLLTNGGVGYEVFLNQNILALCKKGEEKQLYIHQYQTESQDTLYGFENTRTKQIFLACIKISGIGGKAALQLLSLGETVLLEAFINEDIKTITMVKGIGKKMAEKILIEMRTSKIIDELSIGITAKGETDNVMNRNPEVEKSIYQTLEAMGYQKNDISNALIQAPEEYDDASTLIPFIISTLSQ